jgi:hypothetical protein
MPVNRDKPDRWKADIAHSVDLYNDWFMRFAPKTYREIRAETTAHVKRALACMENLKSISPAVLFDNPWVLPILRMVTAPPIARDRLIGLARVSGNLVRNMELRQRIPPHMPESIVEADLARISDLVKHLADRDLFPWLDTGNEPGDEEIYRAATIVADRLCGSQADPIVRNAQEARQLAAIQAWLEARGYTKAAQGTPFDRMEPGTYAFRLIVPVQLGSNGKRVNIPIDAVVMPAGAKAGELPLLIEAKSAGDYTNTNKRRKEEATKVNQLRDTYGNRVRFILFLCGYFDSGYLGYEAAEGIDWVWEHRIDDLAQFGV